MTRPIILGIGCIRLGGQEGYHGFMAISPDCLLLVPVAIEIQSRFCQSTRLLIAVLGWP
jgi:hypothetical protein